MKQEQINFICNKAHEITEEIWGTEHMKCFGNLEVKMQDVIKKLITDCNDNCGHQNEEICNTCPDLCCGIYPFSEKITVGTLALCSMGCLGLITSNKMVEVVYGDGNTGSAYVGIHLTDKFSFIGSRWSSRNPKVVGHINDINWDSVIESTKP